VSSSSGGSAAGKIHSKWAEFPPVARNSTKTMQINLGYRCNQSCSHCHVDAGPNRTEEMQSETIDLVFEYVDRWRIRTLDLTGGAPELHPLFKQIVRRARQRDLHVIDRCNLTVLLEEGQEVTAKFLAENEVHIIASLPCYSPKNVDAQRGKGVYLASIEGMRQLNRRGYGRDGSTLSLDLVYNPQGIDLPPDSKMLERDYKRELAHQGVFFNQLLTMVNMPIKRFKHSLQRDGLLDGYMEKLISNFDSLNLERLMCRDLLSIDYRGYVYDCDFNQMLGLGGIHLRDLLLGSASDIKIKVGAHCYGCAAGRGSSCGGALQS
jgi:radical SAM/Cys-rich protein